MTRTCAITLASKDISDNAYLHFDMGASVSCTFFKADFLSMQTVENIKVTGIGIIQDLDVEGIGTVSYVITDDENIPQTIIMENVLFTPKCPTRIISPPQFLVATKDPEAILETTANHTKIKFRGSIITLWSIQPPNKEMIEIGDKQEMKEMLKEQMGDDTYPYEGASTHMKSS